MLAPCQKTIILRVRYSKLSKKTHTRNFRFISYVDEKDPNATAICPPNSSGELVVVGILPTDQTSPVDLPPSKLVVEGILPTDQTSPATMSPTLPISEASTNYAVSNNKKTKKNKCIVSLSEKSKMWNIYDAEKSMLNTILYEKGVSDDIVITPTENIQQSEQTDNIPKLTTFHRCQSCDHILMIMEDGFPTCTNTKCCIMYKDILDYSPEWRFYGANDKNTTDPTRCGNPINPLLIESSFGCKILCDNRSSYEMKKIRKWTEWQATPHREKSLYEEFQFITIMAQNAGIPKIFIDYAMVIHKDISEQKMFRGMNRDGIKAASIYISCRLNECPRTAHEIADIFKLDKQSTTYGCSMAVNILHNIERNIDPAQKTELGTTTPSAFIDRYCSRLNIMNELAILSKFIAKKVENHSIVCDNTPQSSAAGIVYFVSQICKLDISKLDIKAICGVSEVTINKCYKKLDSIRHQLVPQCILDKYM
uniref:Cyclin-like domain-containing protein n=1 Tax=viral metagenome TaxID=1070528 RepID=A0A6C0IDP4_9ZZZZ